MEKQHNQFPEKGLLTIESILVDLLISIFSRLPVKSIARYRCVSKKWAYILRHRDFTDLYFKISSTRPRLLLNFEVNGNRTFFSVPQDQSSCLLAADRHMSFPTEQVFYRVSASVCGLVVVCGVDRNHPWIYNPSTGQCIALPKTTSLAPLMHFSFGYDPINKLYMVLRKSKDFRVLTLGTGELSWRKIECSIPHWSAYDGEKCINGVVYYIAHCDPTRFQKPYKLVCFDIRFEKFKFLDVDSEIWGSILVNFEGKLGIIPDDTVFVSGETTKLVMWVLDDVQNEKWSKHIYQLPSLWNNLAGDDVLKVVGLTGTCEIVFSPYNIYQDPFYVIYYNVMKNTVRRAEIQLGVVPDNGLMVGTSVDHVENVKLMEVLGSS
ncbi:PREDICTED: putative F-box protein At2g19630 [Camelina sativa]|uniref:F-box protein At2g19630 n=1 Tax=Camelina sativa TaxID=90675 RepID=A0ABM0TTK1_CAMSA|nr:PREDICTED: putative F-box protein At2g19630 [Camelina sativa]